MKELVWATLVTISVAAMARADCDWIVVPGVRAGNITATTSEQDLIATYGQENVASLELPVGEGLVEPVSRLFPNDPRKTADVFWEDASRENPRAVRIDHERTLWRTGTGITIGMTLRAIEQINGGPFVLSGFDWDYGGTVIHCGEGSFEELGVETPEGIRGRTLLLRLSPDTSRQDSREYSEVKGDRPFRSDHPSMQSLNPTVYQMIVTFREE